MVSILKATSLGKQEKISRSYGMIKQAKGLLPKLQVGINLCMSLLPQPPEAKKVRCSAPQHTGATAKSGHLASL